MDANKFFLWLSRYGKCWETGDSNEITNLFSDDAYYYETPFDDPMVGLTSIKKYWSEGADQAQENVVFNFSSVSMNGQIGTCRWQASFNRVPSGLRVDIDGYLEAKFNSDGRCSSFREWWHRKESK